MDNKSYSSLSYKEDAQGSQILIARNSAPPDVEGLYVIPSLLSITTVDSLFKSASEYFTGGTNQVMLFDHTPPDWIRDLLDTLRELLSEQVSEGVWDTLFGTKSPLQVILNLYSPGEGISPHVDLPNRYGDGIIGISLNSSTAMELSPCSDPSTPSHAIHLRASDVYILTSSARYDYLHGIPARTDDWVQEENEFGDDVGQPRRVRRGVRISITLRRMLEGADVVGGPVGQWRGDKPEEACGKLEDDG